MFYPAFILSCPPDECSSGIPYGVVKDGGVLVIWDTVFTLVATVFHEQPAALPPGSEYSRRFPAVSAGYIRKMWRVTQENSAYHLKGLRELFLSSSQPTG